MSVVNRRAAAVFEKKPKVGPALSINGLATVSVSNIHKSSNAIHLKSSNMDLLAQPTVDMQTTTLLSSTMVLDQIAKRQKEQSKSEYFDTRPETKFNNIFSKASIDLTSVEVNPGLFGYYAFMCRMESDHMAIKTVTHS